MGKISSYQEFAKVAKEVADIDIGMLVLNAGAMLMGDFKQLSPEEIESQVNLNGLQPIYLAKALLP